MNADIADELRTVLQVRQARSYCRIYEVASILGLYPKVSGNSDTGNDIILFESKFGWRPKDQDHLERENLEWLLELAAEKVGKDAVADFLIAQEET